MKELWFLSSERASGLKLNLSWAFIKSPISDCSCCYPQRQWKFA